MIRASILISLLTLWPQNLRAHPHIFVDAGLVIDFEAGVVEVTWRYDPLYSLLILQDYGLDQDFDMQLTQAEVATLMGFDLNWNSGFEGGLVIEADDVALTLGAPEAVSVTLTPDGQIEAVHRRQVSLGGQDLRARIYDPAFYIAFDTTLAVGQRGRDCAITLQEPDLAAAEAMLLSALDALPDPMMAEDNFPAIGHVFADQVIMSCNG